LRTRIDQIVTQAQAEGSFAVAVSGLNSLRQTLDSLARLTWTGDLPTSGHSQNDDLLLFYFQKGNNGIMTNVKIYQIYYSDTTRAALDPGFIPLNNLANERPDWREYWPMRKRLFESALNDEEYCGFLSPKFGQRTRLTADAVNTFIARRISDADVFLFSPFADYSGLFLNVFEQGEIFHPGLTAAGQTFFNTININVDLRKFITDSTITVFCNYFVANKKFWSIWFDIAEKLFVICEREATPLQRELTERLSHGAEKVQLKVFVMERIASVVLSQHPELRVSAFCPFDLPLSDFQQTAAHPREALLCDALKIAYRRQNYPYYLQAFNVIRNNLFQRRT
jgi:hypothetical protein